MAAPRSGVLASDPLPGARVLIVDARFYDDIADELLKGAKAAVAAAEAECTIVTVPGALEIPSTIAILIEAASAHGKPYDAAVALGCVIRGETTHYDTVCNDSSRALTMLGLQGLCIGNGILTVENHEQAAVRAEAKGQNKGGGAAAAALHLIALSRKWGRASKGVGFTGEILLAREGQTNA